MSTPASTCYFCIRKIICDGNTGQKDDWYVGVVELGELTEPQVVPIFQAVTHRLLQIINMTPQKGWSVIAKEPRLLQVSECDFEETGKNDITEYAMWFEQEVDVPTIIQWNSKSKSFLRHRYKAALQKLDLDEVGRPENDTILAAAVRGATWSRKKLRPDGYLISLSHAENVCPPPSDLDSIRGKADRGNITTCSGSVSPHKDKESPGLSGSYLDDFWWYLDMFEYYSFEKWAEVGAHDWYSRFILIDKEIDASNPYVTKKLRFVDNTFNTAPSTKSKSTTKGIEKGIIASLGECVSEKQLLAKVLEQQNSLPKATRKEIDPDMTAPDSTEGNVDTKKTDLSATPEPTQKGKRKGLPALEIFITGDDDMSDGTKLSDSTDTPLSREDQLHKEVSTFPPLPTDGKSNSDWMTLTEFAAKYYSNDTKTQNEKSNAVRSYFTSNKGAIVVKRGEYSFGMCGQGRMRGVVWGQVPPDMKVNKKETGYFILRSSTPAALQAPNKRKGKK